VAYKIRLASPAVRALEVTLPEQVAAAAWEFINGALAENPQRVGKPLAGELAGLWSARRGEYRIVYSIEKRIITVTVVRISHRSNAYR
jgi:mRNA-degrading endonuclease RelE of RelBE toxin-antitoxin system